jgi:hypothetical protein
MESVNRGREQRVVEVLYMFHSCVATASLSLDDLLLLAFFCTEYLEIIFSFALTHMCLTASRSEQSLEKSKSTARLLETLIVVELFEIHRTLRADKPKRLPLAASADFFRERKVTVSAKKIN